MTATLEEERPQRLVGSTPTAASSCSTMASAGFAFPQVAKHFPDSPALADARPPVPASCPGAGCSFWDLIQPSFMFMVGVAMPFSYASRRAAGQIVVAALRACALCGRSS